MDTEATMIAAGRLFREKSIEAGGRTAWHGCIDHKLALVTKLAFKDKPESIGTMAACRNILSFFNSSSQATEKQKEKTKARLGAAVTVIQDVVTQLFTFHYHYYAYVSTLYRGSIRYVRYVSYQETTAKP